MPTPTTRLALQEPLTTDSPSALRLAVTNHAVALDNALVWATPTTLVNRPNAFSVAAGTLHRSTDVGVVALSDGSTWHSILADSLGPPIGAVQQYAGTNDPADADGVTRWMVCDARAISRTTYATLFARLGTTYGSGNGSTTFNVPDLRGRVPVGAINAGSSAGAGANNNNNFQGTRGQAASGTSGEVSHTLGSGELPAHSHGVTDPGHDHGGQTATDPATASTVPQSFTGGIVWTTGGSDASKIVPRNSGTQDWVGNAGLQHFHTLSSDVTGITTKNTGGGGSHNSMPPYLVVNHIIRVL